MTPEEERLIAAVLNAGRRIDRKATVRKQTARKRVTVWLRTRTNRPVRRSMRAA